MVNQKYEFIELNNVKLVISSKNKKLYPLQGVTFTIPYNTKVALVGESGSGKSLTAASIIGMLPSNAEIVEGKILMNGSNIVNLSEKEFQQIRGKEISIIFQNPKESLNPIISVGNQIAEVIRVHEKLSRKESINKAIKSSQLFDMIGELSDGLDTEVGERGVRLSGGQKQRLGIARALYHDPEILVLDEATSALDTETESSIVDSLKEIKGKKTILIIAHRQSTVKYCDKLIKINQGRIHDEEK